MPVYQYECEADGGFELYRPMSESGQRGRCPECGRLAPRVISAPRLALLTPATRNAMDRNEKSRHSPHVCGSTCSHKSGPKPDARQFDPAKPKLIPYRGVRPWVIEHR